MFKTEFMIKQHQMHVNKMWAIGANPMTYTQWFKVCLKAAKA